MMIRSGMELIARGRDFSGSLVSAAVVPTSSIPTNANTAIWKPAKKPLIPFGNQPPSFHRWANEACTPVGDWKCVSTITSPTTISAMMATILIIANQNSISPNILTVARFRLSSRTITASEATQSDRPGNQNWA
ncbi:Uncharacterised protein [Enterobacter cloacae]|nr:Uncharacterised protein [Enterobacter cloacae]